MEVRKGFSAHFLRGSRKRAKRLEFFNASSALGIQYKYLRSFENIFFTLVAARHFLKQRFKALK
jgi:hypothetical protein